MPPRSLPASLVALWISAGLVACKPPRKDAEPPRADAAAPSAPSARVEVDAGALPARVVNLLRHGPAHVDVSSNVDNPRDFPEHLVDGSEATAWNGKTGDLVGAKISFAVPKGARITSLVMSAGFNRVTAKGEDLFRMNHRIAKVTVLHPIEETTPGTVLTRERDVVVAEWRLDPDKREPQELPVSLAGGTYVLRIDEVAAGTKKEWRELVVSELRVMGTPAGAPFPQPVVPNVTVGKPLSSLSDPLLESTKFPLPYGQVFGDDKALCKRFDEAVAPAFASGTFVPEKPWCLFGARVALGAASTSGPLKEARFVDIADEGGSAKGLALRTADGWSVPESAIFSRLPCPRGCMDDMVRERVEVERVEVEGTTATLHVKRAVTASDGPAPATTNTTWFQLRCRLEGTPRTCASVTVKSTCAPSGPGCP